MNIRSKLLAAFLPLLLAAVGAVALGAGLALNAAREDLSGLAAGLGGLADTARDDAREIAARLDSRTLKEMRFLALQLRAGFENSLADLARVLDLTARSRTLRVFLADPGQTPSQDLEVLFRSLAGSYRLLEVSVLDPAGQVLHQAAGLLPGPLPRPRPPGDQSGLPWFQARIREPGSPILPHADLEDGGPEGSIPVLTLSCPLRQERGEPGAAGGTLLGYLKFALDLREPTRTLLLPQADFQWKVVVTGHSGRILAASDASPLGQAFDPSPQERDASFVVSQTVGRDFLNLHVITSKEEFREGSRLLSSLAEGTARAAAEARTGSQESARRADAALAGLLVLAALALSGAALAAVLAARRFSRPIASLTRSAERLASGDLEAGLALPPGTPLEISRLAGSLEAMRADLFRRQEAWRRFEFMADASSDFMTLINRSYVYDAVNLAYCRARRIRREDLVGRRVADIWGEQVFVDSIRETLDRCLAGETVTREAAFRFPGLEEGDFLVSYYPYRDGLGDVTHAVCVSRDITKIRRAEALQRAKASAEAAALAKGQLLASISHELRTPMTAILGMAHLLEEAGLRPEERHWVRILRHAGEGLLTLVNDVLDLSRVESGRFELERIPFDPADLVESVCEFLAVKVQERGLEFVCRTAPDLPPRVEGDPARLRQILVNLVGNAVRFTAAGEIEVWAGPLPPEEGRPGLELRVRDTGTGVPEDKREVIFEEYAQAEASTARQYGGTGLGLAISRRLCRMMGGDIRVESPPGGGSLFIVTVRVDAAPAPPEAALAGTQEPPREQSRPRPLVLAAEPHPAARESLAGLLEALGVRAEVFADPARVLQVLDRPGQEPLAAVILAATPGRPPGPDLAQLAAHPRSPARIILAAPAAEAARLAPEARRHGAACLFKPLRRGELALALELPQAPVPPGPDPGTPAPALPDPVLPALRILLADDDPNSRMLFDHFLKGGPHALDQAPDGQAAVVMAQAAPYDIIFMDVEMPGLDGLSAAALIREAARSRGRTPPPILALSGHFGPEARERSLAAGCADHLVKPCTREKVLAALARHTRP